jgi:hypothetical protein
VGGHIWVGRKSTAGIEALRKPPSEDRLISGKLRTRRARETDEHVEIDGTKYTWSRRHGWLVHGKWIKAISLSVSLQPGRTRELILDLVMKVGVEEGPPSDERLQRAGWNRVSRGRAFRYDMGETA